MRTAKQLIEWAAMIGLCVGALWLVVNGIILAYDHWDTPITTADKFRNAWRPMLLILVSVLALGALKTNK